MWGANLIMPHVAMGITGMQDPSKRFGEILTRIDNPRKMLCDKIFLLALFLDGKMLDVNLSSTGCRMLFIDHVESCYVINEQARSKCFKCCEDATKTFDNPPQVTDEWNSASVKLVVTTAEHDSSMQWQQSRRL